MQAQQQQLRQERLQERAAGSRPAAPPPRAGPDSTPALAPAALALPRRPQVAFVAGCMYTGIGLLRMGWVTNFLSHAQVGGVQCGCGQRTS